MRVAKQQVTCLAFLAAAAALALAPAALPVITADERETLLSAAWALNEAVPAPEPLPRGTDAGTRPGDDYSARGDVRAVLQKHGWTLAKPGDHRTSDRLSRTGVGRLNAVIAVAGASG